MKLSWRDALATVLVAAAVAVTATVAYDWNWPLNADARIGALGVFVFGFAASVAGGGPQWSVAALRREGLSTLGMWLSLLAAALGLLTFVLLVLAFFANSIDLLAWATATLAAIWVVATIHHGFEPLPHVTLFGPGRSVTAP